MLDEVYNSNSCFASDIETHCPLCKFEGYIKKPLKHKSCMVRINRQMLFLTLQHPLHFFGQTMLWFAVFLCSFAPSVENTLLIMQVEQ